MNIRIFQIIIFVAVAFVISSCEDATINEQMDKAECLMNEKPDSALIILRNIDKTIELSESQNARYALLYSQALDKNYIDETNDSLINIAVEYYNENGTAKEKFLSLYYWGRVCHNSKDYSKAILAYTKAEQLLPDIEDTFIKGLLYNQLAYLYEQYNDYHKALDAYKRAYSYFDKAQRIKHRNYSRYCIGAMLRSSSDKYKEAENVLIEMLQTAIENGDSVLRSSCMSELIVHYVESGQYEKATILYEKYKSDNSINALYPKFYSSIFLLLAHNNKYGESDIYQRIAWQKARTKGDTILIMTNLAKISELKGEYQQAYSLLNKARSIEVKNVRKQLEHPILTIQKEYLEKELEFNKYKQNAQFQKSILIIILILLLSITIFIYFRYLIKKREYKISEYSDVILELRQKLQENKTVMSELLQNSFKNQFKILNSVGDTIFNQTNDLKGQKIVYNEIKNIVERFKDRKTYLELEQLVNKYCNNVMETLRTEVPSLDDEDYRQLCYHYAGFSGKLISLLLEKKQSNIYMRKSRLKEKIIQINPHNIDVILRYLA